MKKYFLCFAFAALGCSSQRWIPDTQRQVTLIRAYREDKSCGILLNPELFGRTWHIDLLGKHGDTIRHHYFTVSHANQSWLVPGDKYTYSFDSRDSVKCIDHPFIYAKLKWNK